MASKNKQATWGGRFSDGPAALMQKFSESVSFDRRLAPFDIQGSRAQAKMLAHTGIINDEERDAIITGLDEIEQEIAGGNFSWDESLEDVHMNIEQALTDRVPAAAKLHTARSRNDQVATDMRLFFKDGAAQLQEAIRGAQRALLTLARKGETVYIPGYTHLQRAQPVSIAHHILAYVEMLDRDVTRFAAVSDEANICPLGSGAIAGTTLPIDRLFTARELSFVGSDGEPRVTSNSMDAVSDRDVFISFAHACSVFGAHVSRLSEDMILWSSAEFGFVHLPDTFTTGSSLMPQKKNPDAFELLRGKVAQLGGIYQTLLTLVKGLPLTYNRDLQDDKPPVFAAFDLCMTACHVLQEMLPGIEPVPGKCTEAVSDPLLLATDVVDYLVRKGVAFREAHHVVGALVALSEKSNTALPELPLDKIQNISHQLGADWVECFDIAGALARREEPGMPGPEQTRSRFDYWSHRLA
ncbi:MAG: argininosuccinate lyase [Opitutales bacterium]|nr:argininosuccinate lyase [Opitutales bacterium]